MTALDLDLLRRAVGVLERELAKAQAKSTKAMEARMRRPPGTIRAKATTLNARWAIAAEHRDRVAESLEKKRAELAAAEAALVAQEST